MALSRVSRFRDRKTRPIRSPPTASWGSMISEAQPFIRGYTYYSLFPGLAIIITVLSFNLLGDGLRDAFDPKLRK